MSNQITLTGRLANFAGRYTAAEDGKSSRMNWGINVTQPFKEHESDQYNYSVLVNFTIWGKYADMLQEINLMDKDDPRKKGLYVTVCGKIQFAHLKDGAAFMAPEISATTVDLVHFLDTKPATGNQSQAAAPAASAGKPTGNFKRPTSNFSGMRRNSQAPHFPKSK